MKPWTCKCKQIFPAKQYAYKLIKNCSKVFVPFSTASMSDSMKAVLQLISGDTARRRAGNDFGFFSE